MIGISPGARRSDYHHMGNYVIIRLSPGERWSDYHHGQLCDYQIITRGKMIRLSSWATMWWSDYHHGQLCDDHFVTRGNSLMIRLCPGARWSDNVQGQDDQIITRGNYVMIRLCPGARWSYYHQGQDGHIITSGKMLWSDYVQGQGALRNCDFEDDLCSWTIDSELNRFTNIPFLCFHGELVNFVFINSWERTLFVLVCSHWELFSTEAFVWNRSTGSEQDGQSGPMIDHEGKSDSE